MQGHVDEPPVVRCPGCHHPMQPKERTSATERLVDIRVCDLRHGNETHCGRRGSEANWLKQRFAAALRNASRA